MEGGTNAIVESMGSAFEVIQGDILSAITVIAPIGLAVAAAVLIWKFGLKFFKTMTNK